MQINEKLNQIILAIVRDTSPAYWKMLTTQLEKLDQIKSVSATNSC